MHCIFAKVGTATPAYDVCHGQSDDFCLKIELWKIVTETSVHARFRLELAKLHQNKKTVKITIFRQFSFGYSY